MLKLEDIINHPTVKTLLDHSSKYMESIGYTEHGERHATLVSETTRNILAKLGYGEREVELGAIAGYLHDIGNMINRDGHGQSGAAICFQILRELGMPLADVCEVATAIGNHEEKTGLPAATPITAALIIADKSDAHRTRVRKKHPKKEDLHDLVNYAVRQAWVDVSGESRTITLNFVIDNDICPIINFFDLYITRMKLSMRAAARLGCTFKMKTNGNPVV